jgi:hypothetical protein
LLREPYQKSDPAILQEVDRVMNRQPGQELRIGHATTADVHVLDSVEKVILAAF